MDWTVTATIRLSPVATCAACGEESPDDFKFCPHCAAPLTPAASASGLERKTISVKAVV